MTSAYQAAVLSDTPVAYWTFATNDAAGAADLSGNGHSGAFTGGPAASTFPDSTGSVVFNGTSQYFEAPSAAALSVPATGVLTVEAWLRPDVLTFPSEEAEGFVHWMGKGDPTAGQEYVARMYGADNTATPYRANRISGYCFNTTGGQGAGSYFQDTVTAGAWIHYVLVINTVNTSPSYPTGYTKIFKNGALRDQDSLSGYSIVPAATSAKFRAGTRDFASWFKGALANIAVYGYELGAPRVRAHYNTIVPSPAGSSALTGNVGSAVSTTAGTILDIPVGMNVPAGSTVIVRAAHDTTVAGAAVADSKGNAYTADRTGNSSGLNIRATLFSGQIRSRLTAGDIIRLTTPVSTNTRVAVADAFSNLLFTADGGNQDVYNSSSGTSATPGTTISITTTHADDQLIGFAGVQGPSGDSYTEDVSSASWVTLTRAGTGAYDAAVLADSPVFYLTGTLADASGHGHSLTNHGTTTASATLPNGDAAWSFNGTSQWISVADADDLSVVTTGALTIEIWHNPAAVNMPTSVVPTGYVNFFGKAGFWTPPGSNQYEWELRYFNQNTTDSGNIGESLCGYAFTSLSGGIGFGWDDAAGVTAGQWVHTVVVYDCTSSPSRVTIYRNGVQANTTTFTGTPQNGTGPVNIGSNETAESDQSFWDGSLGKAAIYPTALSSARILAHYQAMSSGGGTPDFTVNTAYDPVGSTAAYSYKPVLGTSRNWLEILGSYKAGAPTVTQPDTGTALFIQSLGTATATSAGTALTITVPPGGVPAGHTVIVRTFMDFSSGAPTVADVRGNTYTRDRTAADGGSSVRLAIFSCPVTTALAGGDAITVTSASLANRTASASEFAGLVRPSVIDAQNGSSGTGTAPSVAVTTTRSYDLLIAAVGAAGPSSDGYTEDLTHQWTTGTAAGTSALALHAAYRPVGTSGTYTYAPVLGTSRTWVGFTIAYQAVSLTGGPMAALTSQVVPHAGVTPTLTTGLGGTSGNTAPCGNGLALMLVNGTASTCVITMHVPAAITFDGLVIPNRTFTLPATSGAVSFIPLVTSVYADPTTALCTFDVAAGTVSAAVVAISS